MQEADERTITSTLPLAILPSGLIRDFVASPGKVILCLDAEAQSAGRIARRDAYSRNRGGPW
jgi:hypothetical protein